MKTIIKNEFEIHVNLRKNKNAIIIYQKGKEPVTFIVSAGKATRPGEFIFTKRDDPTKIQGKWGLQYFASFDEGRGFHSTEAYPTREIYCTSEFAAECSKPENKAKKRFHLTLVADGIARSHGCIRLNPDDAKWLYENVPNGTNVIIYDEETFRQPSWAKTSDKSSSMEIEEIAKNELGEKPR